MASRRRPSPHSPSDEPSAPAEPDLESLTADAERTQMTEAPVFDDPKPSATPPPARPRTGAPPPARSRAAPPPAGRRSAPPPARAAPPPAAPRSRTAPPPARPRTPPPARPDRASPPDAPPARREVTFVGLPIGASANPAPDEAPTPRPELEVSPSPPSAAPVAAPPPLSGPERGAVSVTPAAPPSGLSLPGAAPAAAPPPPPAAPPAASAPPPLSFDREAIDAKPPSVPVYPGAAASSAASRYLAGLALLVVAAVAGAVVVGGRGAEEGAPGRAGASAAASAGRATRAPVNDPPARVAEGSPAPSSPRRAAKDPVERLVRKAARRPVWTRARVEAAQEAPPGQIRFGGEPIEETNHRRPYETGDDYAAAVPMLFVFTQPPGMTVRIDGEIAGRTPLVRPVAPDVARVQVKLTGAGYRPVSDTLLKDKDGAFRLNTLMTPEPPPG